VRTGGRCSHGRCPNATSDRGYNPLFFAVRKFFESEVQCPVGSLTRPVTGDQAHDHTRQQYDRDHDDGSLHTDIYANGAPFEEGDKESRINPMPHSVAN